VGRPRLRVLAPVGALQFNENLVDVVVRPGPHWRARGGDARPPGSDLVLADVRVTTTAPGSRNDLSIARFPGRREVHAWGSIAAGSRDAVSEAAVDNPTLFFVSTLRDVLQAEGIAVDGAAVDIDDVADADALASSAAARTVLVRHQSAPLSELGKTLMKASQNLYAETIQRTLSLVPGPHRPTCHAADGADAPALGNRARTVPHHRRFRPLAAELVSAAMIVRILREMARDPATWPPSKPRCRSRPDGTIAGRMKGTRAEANAVAKTGTLGGVRSLSGYVRTLDGERLVFSFIANHFTVPSSAVDAVVDQSVERLANFKR